MRGRLVLVVATGILMAATIAATVNTNRWTVIALCTIACALIGTHLGNSGRRPL